MTIDTAETKDRHAGFYVVALIDMLGQRGELDQIAALAKPPFDRKRLEAMVKASARRLNALRKVFVQGCKTAKTNPPSNRPLDAEEREALATINAFYPPVFQGFGDTVIAFTPIADTEGRTTVQPFFSFLGGCIQTILWSFAEACPVRGALDVGFGFSLFDNEIYGPVMQSVHELESCRAKYPRIVVGERAVHYLRSFAPFKTGASLTDNYNGLLAEQCIRSITQDADNVPIIDYAGCAVRDVLGTSADFHTLLTNAHQFAQAKWREFCDRGDEKLASRYRCLLEYLKANAEHRC